MSKLIHATLIVLTLAFASSGNVGGAIADETAPPCSPLAVAQAEIQSAGGGKLKTMTHEQLLFARGLFVASPPVSPYPPGDDGMISLFEDGASTVVFVDGDKSCGKMGVSPLVTKLLVEIDNSI
jgi:hypothetical protein